MAAFSICIVYQLGSITQDRGSLFRYQPQRSS